MDAAASSTAVCDFVLRVGEPSIQNALKQRHTFIKYTRIPDFDFDAKGKWGPNSYTLPPRLRRIVTLEEPFLGTSRSMKLDTPVARVMASQTRRKIVTIDEDRETHRNPKSSKASSVKSTYRLHSMTNKAIQSVPEKSGKSPVRRPLSHRSKSPKELKISPDQNPISTREIIARVNYKPKSAMINELSKNENTETKIHREKAQTRVFKPSNPLPTNNLSRRNVKSSESATVVKAVDNRKDISRLAEVRTRSPRKSATSTPNSNLRDFCHLKKKKQNISVIHVPLVDKNVKKEERCFKESNKSRELIDKSKSVCEKTDCGTNMDIVLKDMSSEPITCYTCDQVTDTDDVIVKRHACTDVEFESLNIPNVTLTKERTDKCLLGPLSLPNLIVPQVNVSSQKIDNDIKESSSFIIGRATLTYTTKQQINFHVVGKENSLPTYPLSVVSVFKRQVQNKENNVPNNSSHSSKSSILERYKSADCSYVMNRDRLVKPSDIISEIRVNSEMVKNDFLSEQFCRELNFIDSFFESLQYLESSSLSDKSLALERSKSWVSRDLAVDKYGQLLSNLESGAICNPDTMATKSLCLLNLLIQDEQRRAKNLLFVLKMREDALRDFTKSQILWLENKKKLDNTDVSTLKKKQRGALLRLQHECGEMQRMRKALLALSEKRKSALIKTKKNIELKLTSSVDVEKILSGKKRLRRSSSSDRSNAPLKCFELSSSTCDEVRPSRAEKCVQTGDVTPEPPAPPAAVAEHNVAVDGGFLNILFQDIGRPQIFSSGKQYEVNEEALKNILQSASSATAMSDAEAVGRLIDQIKGKEDRSTSPSTARSLVDEFDQYYKNLVDEDKGMSSQDDCTIDLNTDASEILKDLDNELAKAECEDLKSVDVSCDCELLHDDTQELAAGPLVVPPGAPIDSPADLTHIDSTINTTEGSSQSLTSSNRLQTATSSGTSNAMGAGLNTVVTSIISPVDYEAERLRQQQIAIEKEIKALEQQQCQLLVVREIPDKPPPPYTPPADSRQARFTPTAVDECDVERYVNGELVDDESEAFHVYCQDFCIESRDRQKSELSEEPWAACNLLPRRPDPQRDAVVANTFSELKDVLTVVPATSVTGLSQRRSDHIDDILFAEWRRCEPDWTALHVDEAVVKNQIFDSIFQRVLNETIDEYKKNVRSTRED